MALRCTLYLLCALSLGFVSTPSHAADIISCDGFENCPDGSIPLTNALLALEARMDALEAENTVLKADNEALNALLAGVSRITDSYGDTLRFTNMNVQVVSGSGSTSGLTNGTGNLILGYNEIRPHIPGIRSGSHMLVVGARHDYSSYGGILVGNTNQSLAPYASVSGGANNTASGDYASISGGSNNTASGVAASISVGKDNTASGDYASISGGSNHTASGDYASISGGWGNTASNFAASVSGGSNKTAAGYICMVGDNGVDC